MSIPRDLERAWRFAERLETGAVGVNVNDTTRIAGAVRRLETFGRRRELGPEGLMAFREPKHIKLRLRGLAAR